MSERVLSKEEKLIKGLVLINQAGFKIKDLFTTKKQLKEMTKTRNYIDGWFSNYDTIPKNHK